MTRSEVVRLLDNCEEQFDLSTQAFIGDVNIWPLLKIKIGEQLIANELGQADHSIVRGNKVHQAIKGGLDLFAVKNKLSGMEGTLFISTGEHWSNDQGCWYEKYAHPFFPLLEELHTTANIALIKARPSGNSCAPCLEIDLQNAIYLRSLLWWRKEKRPELPKVVQEMLVWLSKKEMKVQENYLKEMVFTMLFFDDLFSRLLSGTRIKTIFYVCFYSAYNMGLTLAARRKGIDTVDIQHGVQGSSHIAYGNWLLPPNGYNSLPTWFWCWTPKDADHINSWTQGTPHKALCGGNPWMLQHQKGEDRPVEDLPLSEEGHIVVLYTLQNIHEPIPKILADAIRDSENIQWWFREHPMHRKDPEDLQNELELLKIADKVTLERISDLPLPEVLNKVDVHVTSWSSVVLDAENFGIPSILIHPTGKDVFADLIDQGRARYFEGDHRQLLKAAQGPLDRPRDTRPESLDPKEQLKTILFKN